MKTIRGKISAFFILCLVFLGVLTGLYYENTMGLREKLVIMENFDDLLNDVLELRRYEKNFTYYHDAESLHESLYYFFQIEDASRRFERDIIRVAGRKDYVQFQQDMADYKLILEQYMRRIKTGTGNVRLGETRSKGKALVDFAQKLIKLKRLRINEALNRSLPIPLASIAAFVLLIAVLFQLVNRGILKPLALVEKATEEVAKDTFTPIEYPPGKKDEISRLIGAFNTMAQELEARQEQLLQSRKLASVGTFTSGIAHELNNPLNNISLTAETLELGHRSMTQEEMNELIRDILIQAERAGQVVKNLLEFSRTEKPFLRNLSITDVVERTLNLLKNQIMITGIELEKEVSKDLPSIKGKRQDLEQVFLNILVNGMQAMPNGGKLTVRVGMGPDGYLKTDLSDTGIGIRPSDITHIFDPFFTTKEVGRGTGLGLSLAYGIVRNHGGYIEVKSEINKGTTFSVYLPVAKEEGDENIERKDQDGNRR